MSVMSKLAEHNMAAGVKTYTVECRHDLTRGFH
jgi:hypothetical protein